MLTKQQSVETLSRALAALRADRLDEADALARSLLQAAPRDPAAHQLAANVAFRRGFFAEAEARAASSLALRPGHAPTLMLAGRAARSCENSGRAKDWFRLASQTSEGGAEAWFQLGVAEIECDDPNVSSTLATLVARYPADAAGWREIGGAFMRAQHFDAAQNAFARAVEASDDPSHALNLGLALLACGRAEGAVVVLRRVQEGAPDRLEPLLPLARALRQIGAPIEARARLLRLVDARSDNPQVYYTLGLVCDDQRDWPGAIAAYSRCVQLAPDMPEAHVNLGLALQKTGELEPALQCYRRALRLRRDTFGRIAQALPSTAKGMLWLNLRRLRRSLED
jgi:tetratricopeptide (TPR) repeat protein